MSDKVRFQWSHKAMGTIFNFTFRSKPENTERLTNLSRNALTEMEASWTRFSDTSELSTLNRNGEVVNPSKIFTSGVMSAYSAYLATNGYFDPRVASTLIALGYDKTFADVESDIAIPEFEPKLLPTLTPMQTPIVDLDKNILTYSGEAIDLGGIGKGLALRNLYHLVGSKTPLSFLIEAGGDIVTRVSPNDPEPWFIEIESPFSTPNLPIIIRALTNAIATSSTKVRSWRVNGRPKHHIIDPFTRDSSTSDLVAVTVLAMDPAWAEIESKSIFLRGSHYGLEYANQKQISALLVSETGNLNYSKNFPRSMEVVGSSESMNVPAEYNQIDCTLTQFSITV